jgi:hypothetical protein
MNAMLDISCETCKHWGRETSGTNMRECLNPKLNGDEQGDDCLYGAGMYKEGALIKTGPAFGCIHHETP